MSIRIGLISDPHATPGALAEALEIFQQRDVERVICAGDIAGYFDGLIPTVALLQQHRVQCILGNHDQAFLERESNHPESNELRFFKQLETTLEFRVENKYIYVVHAEPPDQQHGGIKLLNLEGEIIPEKLQDWRERLQDFAYDVLVVGHTHQVFAELIGDVLVINPGSSAFNHSCMVLSLPDMQVETIALENREILKCWNWGKFSQGQ